MNANDPQAIIVGAVLLLAVIGVVILVVRARRKAQSDHLQKRFGPEYSRVVKTVGDRDKAEAELRAREARVERLKLVPLSAVRGVTLRTGMDAPAEQLRRQPHRHSGRGRPLG